METTTGTTIGIIATILIFASPFLAMYIGRLHRERKLLSSLKDTAAKNSSTISRYECLPDFAIGIDDTAGVLFFARRERTETSSERINLKEIKRFKTDIVSGNGSGHGDIPERIEFCFIPANSNGNEIKIELFNKNKKSQLTDELQFAHKWSKEISNLIKG